MPKWPRWRYIASDVGESVAFYRDRLEAGGSFRGEIVVGNGGRQVLLEDPSGNLVELFEPVEK